MQYTGLYFLRLAHVPEIFAEISAGTAGYVHFTLVFIVADGAFPLIIVVDNNFAVEAAHVTIVRLSVKFGILDIVVNEFDNVLYRGKVMAHIGNFHV